MRREVFIEEQKVPEDLEWDEADESAFHVLATSREGKAIGTGRLKSGCLVGRMAVVKEWRGRGVGGAILQALIEIARRERCREIRLHAQTHALDFYRRYGFTAVGDVFDEAGIPHRLMELKLTPMTATSE